MHSAPSWPGCTAEYRTHDSHVRLLCCFCLYLRLLFPLTDTCLSQSLTVTAFRALRLDIAINQSIKSTSQQAASKAACAGWGQGKVVGDAGCRGKQTGWVLSVPHILARGGFEAEWVLPLGAGCSSCSTAGSGGDACGGDS